MTSSGMKVVRVISDREIAVSGGAEAGLKTGDVLLVLSQPTPITDPDTNELLGEVVSNKAVVRVYDVKERFALARTFRTRTVNLGGQGLPTSLLGKYFEPPKFEVRTETLRHDPDADSPLSAAESVVKVGDPVEVFKGDVKDVPTSTVWR